MKTEQKIKNFAIELWQLMFAHKTESSFTEPNTICSIRKEIVEAWLKGKISTNQIEIASNKTASELAGQISNFTLSNSGEELENYLMSIWQVGYINILPDYPNSRL